jgi:myo-inositol-1(or 4)-monophosphatase
MRDRVCFLFDLAKRTGDWLISRQGSHSGFTTSFKGSHDVVTSLDMETEHRLIRDITDHFPQDGIWSEETKPSGQLGIAPYTWIIDPIDGTHNFMNAIPYWALSIALYKNAEPLAGVVYNPASGDLFSAVKGRGAYRNNLLLKLPPQVKPNKAVVATSFPFYKRTFGAHKNLDFPKIFEKIQKSFLAVRRNGSASLDICQVALGHLNGYFEFFLKPWDIAAAHLIAQETQILCLGEQKTLATFDSSFFLCALPNLAEEIYNQIFAD